MRGLVQCRDLCRIRRRRGERDAALADYRAAEQRMAATWVEVPVALADVRAHVASLAAAP